MLLVKKRGQKLKIKLLIVQTSKETQNSESYDGAHKYAYALNTKQSVNSLGGHRSFFKIIVSYLRYFLGFVLVASITVPTTCSSIL